MHLDDALKVLGQFGRYQKTRLLLLCGFAVVSAWHALNMVFVGAEPKFHCATADVNATLYGLNQSQLATLLIPEGESCRRFKPESRLQSGGVTNETLLETELCPAGYQFSTDEYESTITSEFDLVCARKFWRSTSKSVFFAGRLVGAVIFGQLSDRFGRRPMFFVGVGMLMLAGSVAAAAPSMLVFLPMYFMQGAAHTGAFLVSYTLFVCGCGRTVLTGSVAAAAPSMLVFLPMYFMQGAAHTGTCLVSYTLSTELVGPKYRVIAGFVIQSFYSVGFMSLAGIAYFIRSWRYLEVAITAPALLFVVYWWLLPESTRWLLSRNKDEEARRVLAKAAKINGKDLSPELLKGLQDDPAMKSTRQYTFIDCVRTWDMARLSLNVWFNWLVNALVYYGLSLNTENLAGSPYLNFCLAGAVEIPAYVICILLLNRVGRRTPLIVTMYLGGVACIISGLLPTDTSSMQTISVVLAMVGKFGITASYGIIYLAAAEVFPTVVRNIGMGVSSMSARIGGILAPLILETSSVMPVLPMLIFGGLSVAAATLAFLLPETAGRPLPQLLEDVDSGRGCAKSFCCCTDDTPDDTNDIQLEPKKRESDNPTV